MQRRGNKPRLFYDFPFQQNEMRNSMTKLTFNKLSLPSELLTAVTEMGFTETTAVQAEAIPLIRSGVDVLACSQTGTGKTAAFGIPAVECISAEEDYVQVLILTPTRELAQQCGDEIRKLARHLPYVKTADIFGGANYTNQFKSLRKANLVIGTPGRVMDHMRRESIKLDHLKMIILDEADEMLNMGFKEDIETILQDVPEERQIVLFSATVPDEILAITKQFQKNPVQVNINREQATLEEISQTYVDVPMHRKPDALNLLLHYFKPHRAIIFANTKTMVDELVEFLVNSGFSTEGLHGDMKQLQRTSVMRGFKKGQVNILVATDVAARGIDVSDVDYVINYDIPKMSEYYIHRIGRTGRAGRVGTAITLCCGKRQVTLLQQLGSKIKSKIMPIPLPTITDVEHRYRSRDLEYLRKTMEQAASSKHLDMISELTSEGYTTEQIAAALMNLTFRHDLRGLVNIKVSSKDTNNKEEAHRNKDNRQGKQPIADLVLNIGSSNRVAPNHIVGAITEYTGISSKSIGRIEISSEHSTVGVPANQLNEILLAMKGCKICGKPISAIPLEDPFRAKGSKSRFASNRKEHKFHSSGARRRG